jgi:large subunit ribosomal protein L24
MAHKLRLRRGDEVIVVSGRDKGRKGRIVRMQRDRERVIVQGANMVKRHTRPSAGQPGGIVEKEAALHISNVALVDPKTGEASRIGYKFLEDGRKVRFAKASGEVIDA